jgi:hypothetical protein
MCPDQPVSDRVPCAQTVELLNTQLAAPSDVFERMVGSSRNVGGVGFIMFDESCGQIAQLMDACCALIAAQVEHVGGHADWPVRIMKAHAPDGVCLASSDAETGWSAALLDALGQSLLEAVAVAEARGERSSAAALTRVWRDIDRYQWQILPQETADNRLLISLD